ncbi:MAG: YegP family protein [Verrucomicrobiae bacterium]|nr:YegP family protein [Verrucomicrobiae bacterium]MCP5532489.1 YegP family protein [Akkermansiaceae bacterium]MCP5545754.1 YegP family protein [Akkermansiaceae bacterium]
MNGYYKLKTTEGGKFRFNLHAGNHEVILTSQLYGDKGSANNGIESVRANGPHEERFERKSSAKGEPYFLLKAANSQIIGTSEMYSSEAARDNGIRSVMSQSATETVKEEDT